jgi:uncharacterized lipoprotein
MKSFYRLLATSLLVAFIAACGSGSTSDTAVVEAYDAPASTQPLQK